MITGSEGSYDPLLTAYRGVVQELDRHQFTVERPVLVMRQARVGWGGQISCRIVGLKLALATGRRAVFWGHDDPPYGQVFAPMFGSGTYEVAGAPSFKFDGQADIPITYCDYQTLETTLRHSWSEIDAIAAMRIGSRFGIESLDSRALTGIIFNWMRPLPEVGEEIRIAREQLGITEETLGIHIRRGDKQIETAFIPASVYNTRIADLHSQWRFDSLFVASDDASAPSLLSLPAGVRLIFDEKERRYNNANAKMVSRTPLLAMQETMTAARNVFLLATCGGLIGQKDANFSQLAAGSLLARGTSSARVELIDGALIERADPIKSRIFQARRKTRGIVKWAARRLQLLS